MSQLWFTADMHFGHANIAVYCNRPYIKAGELTPDGKWASPEAVAAVESRMREDLIRRWNERVHPEDTVIHVGDFCNRGCNRGIPGPRLSPEYYESLLNGKILFVHGNHDRNNGLKFAVDTMVMPIGGRLAYIQHRPLEDENLLPASCEFAVCGHVHDKWRTKWLGGALLVNVGIDANGLCPVSQSELIGIVSRAERQGVPQ